MRKTGTVPRVLALQGTVPVFLLAFCILSCGIPAPNRQSAIANRDSPPAPRPSLPTVELRIKDAHVFAEVVSQPEDRALGLMFRRSMAPDSGMLFVFDTSDYQRFWMKNTLIPLSIAYITRDSLITDILEMAPLDTTTPYLSSKPVLYALEMNSGWFQSKGIKPGDTVRGLVQK